MDGVVGVKSHGSCAGAGGGRDTGHRCSPLVGARSWYPQSTSPQPMQPQGCPGRSDAGLGSWAARRGQRSALTPGFVCQHESPALQRRNRGMDAGRHQDTGVRD